MIVSEFPWPPIQSSILVQQLEQPKQFPSCVEYKYVFRLGAPATPIPWPRKNQTLFLATSAVLSDCIILRTTPSFGGEAGFCPAMTIHGLGANASPAGEPALLYSHSQPDKRYTEKVRANRAFRRKNAQSH
eukprot:1181453-Prorocentrum_minimum.AAC.5